MPSKTEKQKKFFGAAMGAKEGQSNVSGEAKKVANKLPKKEIKKFLKTEDEEDGTIPMKPDWMGKPKDKFPARKSAKEVGKNPTRKTAKQIRGEEDEQSVSKSMKKGNGKATFKGPKVKERKKFAPATKVESPKKGKGAYDRKETFDENANIVNFIDSILTKNYAAADKYIKQAVECKIQDKIKNELSTPLF